MQLRIDAIHDTLTNNRGEAMNEANSELMQALESKHGKGRVRGGELPDGTLVAVRTPKRAVWKTTVDKLSEGTGKPDSTQYNLVRQSLAAPVLDRESLDPDLGKLDGLVEDYPGIVQSMFDAAAQLAKGGVVLDLSGN
jgi:hypothetical protein